MDDNAEAGEQGAEPDRLNEVFRPSETLRLIGIASSAGGLEAVSSLVTHLPEKANAVYIIAQHMSPTHKSLLSSLISRETALPVKEIEGDVTPEPDTIYVTPPNKDVVFEDGQIRLKEPTGHFASPKPSGDRLFKSLAKEVREHCMGIVLSGTGSDGSYGVQAIREVGGITISQDPANAKYDGMPSAAIETGCIDLTLTPEMIGRHLGKILETPRDLHALVSANEEKTPFQNLFSILLARTNVDFREYKKNTIIRRISRRMAALGINSYEAYTERCRIDESEVQALFRDLLISVTRFFRDPEQFDYLKADLERLLTRKDTGQIRVWVVGCATGEEAYSIAITIFELMGGLDEAIRGRVRIFATDIDQNAIDIARRGVYPVAAAQDVPRPYLEEYFTYGDSEIIVRPEIREAVLFSHHNAFQDPPFVNVDLVSIRNVLIYFNQALQERVLSRIHYSMAPDGLLFLGMSETVGDLSVFFQSTSGTDKILRKRVGATRLLEKRDQAFFAGVRPRMHPQESDQGHTKTEFRFAHEDSLISAVAQDGFVCTKEGQLIEIIGNITPFAQIDSDTGGLTSVKILKEPLRTELQSMVYSAARKGDPMKGRWHQIEGGPEMRVQMKVYPFVRQSGEERIFLVAIESSYEAPMQVSLDGLPEGETTEHIRRLELELETTREALQQNIEELQTSNEELQSANEELQSTNEEFQATNEELETSNEELQSTNEELLTVNEELQVTATERQELASELEATLMSAPYVMLFADVALMVRRASKPAVDLFAFKDIPPSGVHLSQAVLPNGVPALAPIANEVLRLQQTQAMAVHSDGEMLAMSVSPVTDSHGKPIGIVLLMVPHFNVAGLETMLAMVADAHNVGHWKVTPQDSTVTWSDMVFELYGLSKASTAPSLDKILSMLHPEDLPMVQRALEKSFEGQTFSIRHRVQRGDGSEPWLEAIGVPVLDPTGSVVAVNGAVWLAKQAE